MYKIISLHKESRWVINVLWHINPLLVAQLVSRHRPVNKVPRSRDDVTCVSIVARRRAAILSDTTVGGVLMVRRPATASETKQWPLLGTADTAQQYSDRFRGVRAEKISWRPAAIQSQFVRSSPTSEVSIGDRHGKCELNVYLKWAYVLWAMREWKNWRVLM
jgi:hypothetical protein